MKKFLFLGILLNSYAIFAQITISNDLISEENNGSGYTLIDPTVVDSTTTIEVSITSAIVQVVYLNDVEAPFNLSTDSLVFTEIGQTQTFNVSLNPLVPGFYSTTLNATGSIFGDLSSTFEGEGTLAVISTSYDSLSINFGDIPITQTSTQCFDVSNTGSGTMIVAGMSATSEYISIDNSNFSLVEGATDSVCLTFEATLAGDWEETLTIFSSDPNNGAHQISLVGTSISEIGGDVSGNLGVINSPYFIVEDLLVPDGEILTIEPGVEIYVQNNSLIKVEGSLYAVGTENDSIIFNSLAIVNIDSSENQVELDYCAFKASSINNDDDRTYLFEDFQDGDWNEIVDWNDCHNTFSIYSNNSFFRDEDPNNNDYYLYTYNNDHCGSGKEGQKWRTHSFTIDEAHDYLNLEFDFLVEKFEYNNRVRLFRSVNGSGYELLKDFGTFRQYKEFHMTIQQNDLNVGDVVQYEFRHYLYDNNSYRDDLYFHYDNFHIYGTNTTYNEMSNGISFDEYQILNTVSNPENQYFNMIAYEEMQDGIHYLWDNNDGYNMNWNWDHTCCENDAPNYQYDDWTQSNNYYARLGYSSSSWGYAHSKRFTSRYNSDNLTIQMDWREYNDNGNDQMKFYYRTEDNGSWTEIFHKTEEEGNDQQWRTFKVTLDEEISEGEWIQLRVEMYEYAALLDNLIMYGISGSKVYATGNSSGFEVNSSDIKISNSTNCPGIYLGDSDLTIENSNSTVEKDFIKSTSDTSHIDINNFDFSGGRNFLSFIGNNNHVDILNSDFNNISGNLMIVDGNELTVNSENVNVSNSGRLIDSKGSNHSITIKSSTSNNSGGIFVEANNSTLTLERSVIENSIEKAISLTSDSDTLNMSHTMIMDGADDAIYLEGSNGLCSVKNSVIARNNGYGIYSGNSHTEIDYSTIFSNTGMGVQGNSGLSYLRNSVVSMNNNSYSSSSNQSGLELFYSLTDGNAQFADEDGHLEAFSDAVDGAMPWHVDAHMPAGIGKVRADMGAYGGPDNAYWGGENVPDGSPVITSVADIPDDQGGAVGVEFNASVFDGNHSAYDVNRYSFWRDMDLVGGRAIIGETENSMLMLPDLSNKYQNSDEVVAGNWEMIGEMTSNDFDAYGFSATTLADSVEGEAYINTYVVIAHTEDEDVYWYSDTLSGYSVDNIAPLAPTEMIVEMEYTAGRVSWADATDFDYEYSNIYRNSELIGTTHNTLFIDNDLIHMEQYEYEISHVDVHGNEGESASVNFTASIAPWDPINGSITHTVNFPDHFSLAISGQNLQMGDYVGAFVSIDGDLICIGQFMWDNTASFMSLNIAEEYVGQEILWQAYDASTGGLYDAVAEYNSFFPQSSQLMSGGFSEIISLSIQSSQTLTLNSGWSMISSNISPNNKSIESVLQDAEESVFIVKDDLGSVYWPYWAINSIGSWSDGSGYLVKMNSESIIEVTGQPLLPEITPISLDQGWNMMAYLPSLASMPEILFENTIDKIIILKDDLGNVYFPEYNLNTIGSLEPGEGYQIKLTQDLTYTYPKVDQEQREDSPVQPPVYYKEAQITGSNMTLIIPEDAWLETPKLGDEIVAYDANNNVVGSSVFNGGNHVMALWGDDITTDVPEALSNGESFYLNLWSQENQKIHSLDIHSYNNGNGTYTQNDIQVISSISYGEEIVEGQLQLKAIIPNPTSGNFSVSLSNPFIQNLKLQIYNSIGELVHESDDSNYLVGDYIEQVNLSHLNGGSYIIKLVSDNDTDVLPLQLIK